jgi:hypothetical protein
MRPSEDNFHEILGFAFNKEPSEPVPGLYEIHLLQLPKFLESQPDYNNPLHTWFAALCRTQEITRPLKEIVLEDENLKSFYQTDLGFAQFVDHCEMVAADPKSY